VAGWSRDEPIVDRLVDLSRVVDESVAKPAPRTTCGRTSVVRPIVAETVSLGAAYAAGLALGFWSGRDELCANWQMAAQWKPEHSPEIERGYRKWRKAVARTTDWLDEDDE
jgi:hypothetical protein